MARASDRCRTARQWLAGFSTPATSCSKTKVANFTCVDRSGNVLQAPDDKISPLELEGARIEYPAFAEAAVVHASDPTRWSVPKGNADVVAGFESTVETLYQRIRRARFFELPNSISRKIRLRASELAGGGLKWNSSQDDFPEVRA